MDLAANFTESQNLLNYPAAMKYLRRFDFLYLGASTAEQAPAGITPGSSPSCICLNPDNPTEILVTFSNYNVPSIWYSDDDGIHWTDIEGNLGGTDGPYIR